MRDHIARLVCVLSLAMVVALAALFAWRHNPGESAPHRSPATSPAVPPAPLAPTAQIERGRVLFAELDCATCHSFRGQGNPRRPLDDRARRMSPAQLAGGITGNAATALSPTVLKRKQRYQDLSPEDLAALVAFLSAAAPVEQR